ncbi:conserved hypothetical protein [Paraburkholderia piptadeniae]|uniref:PhnO n=1 Tax=Paraburkholderia piptadeniae TaxID=1701573 RepID=A0A1N7SUI4_9BURK|nr:DUF3579 domain-containing protein [Paraburkholderia piptadeniae]SIT51026.1 conserved hypothetical protein [Paraburkholderia piptadeniae]
MDRIRLTRQDDIEGYLIRGITHRRNVFRPGDWTERLMGVITLFVGEKRPGFHVASTHLAMPVIDAGIRCLFVCAELRDICPGAFDFVIRFAEDNELPVNFCTAPLFSAR